MRRALSCMLVLFAPLPALAQRQPDAARPTAQERAWLEGCVTAAMGQPPRAAFGRCGWRIVASCQGYASESLLDARMPQVPGRLAEPRGCAPVEAALWQELLDRWQADVAAHAPAAAEPLRRAHRAFMGYRDSACAVEGAVARGTLAQDNAAGCRLEATALRALEIKRMRDELVAEVAMRPGTAP